MNVLFDQRFTRSLKAIPPDTSEIWLFEAYADRLAAERKAYAKGHRLRVRSAYKPLLHEVIEQNLLESATSAIIHYPVITGCPTDRFLLECYPLHAIYSHCDITFAPEKFEGDGIPAYRVELSDQIIEIKVPVRWRVAPDGSNILANCGWVIDDVGQGQPFLTDYEQIFAAACEICQELPLTPLDADEPDGPFFERLEFLVSHPATDQRLPVGQETISLQEVMHEEIYFTALEIFRDRLNLGPLARSVKCGQLVPLITKGSPKLKIRRVSAKPQADSDQPGTPELVTATHWLSPSQIWAHLGQIGGTAYICHSRQGRLIEGRFVKGTSGASLAISAGQHSNETSPVVGALRAAQELADRGEISFTINPLENPDGFALFREFCQDNPNHMHHAARYTASGADLDFTSNTYENTTRQLAYSHLPAQVHVNLHGYPAHEWTRPLSGYIPTGFAEWTIPKGFFLILRYDPAYEALARSVLTAGLEALADYAPLAEQNRRMLSLYQRYVSKPPFHLHDGCIPYTTRQSSEPGYPVTLITEAADETIYGEDFRIAHEGQYRVVKAVADRLLEHAGAMALVS